MFHIISIYSLKDINEDRSFNLESRSLGVLRRLTRGTAGSLSQHCGLG